MSNKQLLSIFPRDNYDQRVADFLIEKNVFILFDPIMHATDLLEGEDPSRLSDDNVDLLAAAHILNYISEIQAIDDQSFTFISKEVVKDFYKIDEEKLLKKVLLVKEKLREHEFDYLFNFSHNNSFLSQLIDEEDIDPWIFEVKVNAKPGLLDKIKTDIAQVIKSHEIEAEILNIEENEGRIYITFSCTDEEEEEFVTLVQMDKMKGFRIRNIYDWTNIFAPSLHHRTSMANHLALGLEGKEFNTEEELFEFMNSKMGKKLDDVKASDSPILEVMDIYFMEKEESLEAIEQFMKKHSDYLDVYVVKAGWATDGEERLSLLETAIELGEKQLNSGIYKDHGPWWYDINTRPYMLAKLYYANELKWYEYEEEAEEIYWDLLNMNPTDNMGVRYMLANAYLMDRNWKKYLKLRAKFHDDGSLVFNVADILSSYFIYGKSAKTKKTIFRAIKTAPEFFTSYLGLEETGGDDYVSDDYENATDILTYYLDRSDMFARYFAKCLTEIDDIIDMIENNFDKEPFSEN